jgi:transmembrane sensor
MVRPPENRARVPGNARDFFAWRREARNAQAFEEAERFWTEAEKLGNAPRS